MKKVLYIGGFELPDKNAAAQRVMSNAKLLRQMGFEVSFIGYTKTAGAEETVEFNGFPCTLLPYPDSLRRWIRHMFLFVSREELARRQFDYVILYNFPSVAGAKIIRYCHRRGIRVIHDVTEWEHPSGLSLRSVMKRMDTFMMMRHVMYKMDGIIAISHFLEDFYRKRVPAILVPPTVDLGDEKWGRGRDLSPGNKIQLVFAGNAGLYKDRLDYVIEAVRELDNLELTVVGMTEIQYAEVFGTSARSAPNVHFVGRLGHLDALEQVRKADFQTIIRNDNRKTRAGFPTKFVESFSCCTPVIATLTSDIGLYLKDGENGFVVDEDHSLKSVLQAVSILSREDIIRMKENCRSTDVFDYRHYEKEFSRLFSMVSKK